MYEYIIGNIVDVFEDRLVLESNMIGYSIYTSANTLQNISERENVKIRTHLSVREDDMTLYGFLTYDELEMFRLLQTVSKIGPKVAIGILSALSSRDIKEAILFNDTKVLTKAPGVGAKTAQRMILELKDKISEEDILRADTSEEVPTFEPTASVEGEVLEALVSLGYSRAEVYSVLAKIDTADKSVEDILKQALVMIGK